MSSRDRLSKNAIRYSVEKEIEQLLKNNAELRRLQQERREEDVNTTLSEEKPLETVLSRIFSSSPTLKSLFLRGQRLSRPFAATNGNKQAGGAGNTQTSGGTAGTGGGGAGNGSGTGAGLGTSTDEGTGPVPGKEEFKGRRHPTYFRTPNSRPGETYKRNCEEGRRCRIEFETDVENGYFDRATDKGQFVLDIVESTKEVPTPSFSMTLEDGTAYLNMALPEDMSIGDQMVLQASVADPTLVEPLVSLIKLTVTEHHDRPPGPPRPKKPKPGGISGGSGSGGDSGGNDSAPQGIKFPRMIDVHENDSNWQKHSFDLNVACHVISDPVEIDGVTKLEHTFFINLDNAALKTEMKYAKENVRLLQAKFRYGNVLLGLAMLHQAEDDGELDSPEPGNGARKPEDENQLTVQDTIRKMSSAIAPVLIPMIDQLSGISEEQMDEQSTIGEDI